MKVLISILMAVYVATAKIDSVQLVSSLTNEHDVVVIFLKGTNGQYTIQCNRDQETCRFPAKGRPYDLMESDSQLYKCHNVELDYGTSETLGPYCLDSVE